MRTANFKMSEPISNLEEFSGSNVFSEYKDKKYIVYSYGYHYPMYIYMNGKWVGNSTKYSVTTSKHMTQAYPGRVDFYCPTKQMKQLASVDLTLEDICK